MAINTKNIIDELYKEREKTLKYLEALNNSILVFQSKCDHEYKTIATGHKDTMKECNLCRKVVEE